MDVYLTTFLMVITSSRADDWNGSTDYERPKTNCAQGLECSSCEGNKTGIIQFKSEKSMKVCCPGCSSRYFQYGWDSDEGLPFCNCKYDEIEGSVWKGEECNVTGMTTYGGYGDMPLCCPDPLVMVQKERNGSKHVVNCEKHGNCWRGSMCSNCTDNSSANGVPLCCPGCEEGGKTISIGDVIGCHCLKSDWHNNVRYVGEDEAKKPENNILDEDEDEDEDDDDDDDDYFDDDDDDDDDNHE